MSSLTNEQIERYSRHIILDKVGGKGQEKLLGGKVLVIGTGGYVCGPILLAASLMHIPTLIQEQNVVPGSRTRSWPNS